MDKKFKRAKKRLAKWSRKLEKAKRLKNKKRIKKTRRKKKEWQAKVRALRAERKKASNIKSLSLRNRATPGWSYWGGAEVIVREIVRPVASRHGLPLTSAKRDKDHPLSKSNPGSDHNTANPLAYAEDYGNSSGGNVPVAIGDAAAHAIAKALGINNYKPGTYDHYHITVDGLQFRVQILWKVQGHWDHIHVGIRRY